jgi:hypothetical protein
MCSNKFYEACKKGDEKLVYSLIEKVTKHWTIGLFMHASMVMRILYVL